MNIEIQEIASILASKKNNLSSNDLIDSVSIDSRSLQNSSSSLFFALVGPNNDGHRYIKSLLENGVKNFVVQQIPEDFETKANFILVENSLVALQQIAAHYRGLFHFPIIGLTGSNGKTIVKEWINFLLSPDFNVIRSPKSYNSQVGVPLSVLAINEKHNLGIFEAGISTIDEMDKIEPIIRPSIGILTSIGSSHDEGFHNRTEKIREKIKLFKDSKVVIYQKNEVVDNFIRPSSIALTWSFDDNNATVFVHKKAPTATHTLLYFIYSKKEYSLEIPFSDTASIENSISCLVLLLYFKYDMKTIQSRMSQLYPVEMRLQVKNGINNCSLIDDSYSSDFQSLKIALDFLENQKQFAKKTVILSDIFQSGLSDEELYNSLSRLIISNKIDRIIGIGKRIASFKEKFSNCITYQNTDAFISDFETIEFSNENILIKGARSFQFEKIVKLLEEKTHETVLEINLNSISHNLNFFKTKLQPKVKVMVMVKAFGYGNGGFEIAKLLEHHKVDYLGVAFADEGIALKNAGIQIPIMVLNPENTSFAAIIQHQLEPEIYCLKGLHAFLKIAKQKKLQQFPIHIKLDTGMHRLGFEADMIPELIATLKAEKTVKVQSILSHLATSDDLSQTDFTLDQIDLFKNLTATICTELAINPICHILNTSGISNYPEAQFDMVRLGIGLYGVSNDAKEQKQLEIVGTLKSVISQIRTISAGETVGYGRRFVAKNATRVATIPIGYADGISRGWGNELGFVTIKEKQAKILGSICMDMLMVDVTEIDCTEGDVVIIFGESPTVNYIASQLHTIPYEILTSISQRVKRVFYR